MEKNVAVIDLGSNSLRMTISKVINGQITTLETYKKTVRLLEGFSSDLILQNFVIERTLNVLKSFYEIALSYNCKKIFPIATEALRIAKNKEVFLNKARKIGLTFDVISGKEEAYLGYLAIKEYMNIKDGLVLDIGGGSCELVLVKKGECINFASLPLGAVLLSEKFKDEPNSKMYKYVQNKISQISWLDEGCYFDIYGLGGTIRSCGKMIKRQSSNENRLHGYVASYKSIASLYQRIVNTPINKREKILGLDEDRFEIIHGGMTPLKVIMDILSSKCLRISSFGLREGVLIAKRDEIL